MARRGAYLLNGVDFAHEARLRQPRDDMARRRAVEPENARQVGAAQPAELMQRPHGGQFVALADAARRTTWSCFTHRRLSLPRTLLRDKPMWPDAQCPRTI